MRGRKGCIPASQLARASSLPEIARDRLGARTLRAQLQRAVIGQIAIPHTWNAKTYIMTATGATLRRV